MGGGGGLHLNTVCPVSPDRLLDRRLRTSCGQRKGFLDGLCIKQITSVRPSVVVLPIKLGDDAGRVPMDIIDKF